MEANYTIEQKKSKCPAKQGLIWNVDFNSQIFQRKKSFDPVLESMKFHTLKQVLMLFYQAIFEFESLDSLKVS